MAHRVTRSGPQNWRALLLFTPALRLGSKKLCEGWASGSCAHITAGGMASKWWGTELGLTTQAAAEQGKISSSCSQLPSLSTAPLQLKVTFTPQLGNKGQEKQCQHQYSSQLPGLKWAQAKSPCTTKPPSLCYTGARLF